MKDIHHERRQRLTGIALMCGAVALFALLDTVAKYLSAQMPTSQIVAARYITAFLLALVLVNPITHPRLVVTSRPVFQIVRSVLMLATTVFQFHRGALSTTRPDLIDYVFGGLSGGPAGRTRAWRKA